MSHAASPSYRCPDLHCHSTSSDGTLSPNAVAHRACVAGVDLWALTDHDTLDGQDQALSAAQALGLDWVSGVEVSACWAGHTIHIVGLGVDTRHAALLQLLHTQRHSRQPRARAMAQQLDALGIPDSYAGALRHAEHADALSRTHFARYLIECGRASSMADAFGHYLSPGKPGYVPQPWASVALVVQHICAAGGLAVLAHPARYKLAAVQEAALLDAFGAAGGQALEVASSTHSHAQVQHYAAIARQRGWAASCGSDFHSPQESRHDLGQVPRLPRDLTPVWALLQGRIAHHQRPQESR